MYIYIERETCTGICLQCVTIYVPDEKTTGGFSDTKYILQNVK